MRLFYFVIFATSLIANDIVPNKFFLRLESESRTSFAAKVMQIRYELDEDNRSSTGKGEFISEYEFVNTVSVNLDSEAYNSMLMNPEVEEIIPVTRKFANEVQQDATWGQSRTSSKNKVRSKPYTFTYDEKHSGDGVNVYVIDTGVNIKHDDFQGRAIWGTVTIEGATKDDKNGHGTHCAGTIAGYKYGIAKKAKIIAIKVLDDAGEGDDDTVLKGIDYVHKHVSKNKIKTFVVSMSLGGPFSAIINEAVDKLYHAGGVVVVAAGNDDQDACKFSPSSVNNAIVVGSIDEDNKKSSFSNWGKCVKILAPGGEVLSSWIGSKNATMVLSGTSMATPHVAGVAAGLICGNKSMKNKYIIDMINKLAVAGQSFGWTNSSRAETINKILYNGQNS
jgi:subtilisin family serine protease